MQFESQPAEKPKRESKARKSPEEALQRAISSGMAVKNAASFPAERHMEIALGLIDAGFGKSLAKHLDRFQQLDMKAVASKLIEAGEAHTVIEQFDKFKDLDRDIAEKLIASGEAYHVIKRLKSFGLVTDTEFLMKLIDSEAGQNVVAMIGDFPAESHARIADHLIETGQAVLLLRYLSDFKNLDHKKIIISIIDSGKIKYLSHHDGLLAIRGLDEEVALKMIGAGLSHTVIKYFNRFDGLDHKKIAEKIFEENPTALLLNYDLFKGLDDRKFFRRFIADGHFRHTSDRYILSFKGLTREDGLELMKTGEYLAVVNAPAGHFAGLSNKEIAEKLLEYDAPSGILAYKMNLFGPYVDNQKLADKLLEAKRADILVANLDCFKGLDGKTALALIDYGYGPRITTFRKSFVGLDKNVAEKLLDVDGYRSNVAYHLNIFSGLDKSFAMKLIKAGHYQAVKSQSEAFGGLNEEIYAALFERYLNNLQFDEAAEVNAKLSKPDKAFESAWLDFDEYLTLEVLEMYRSLLAGTITEPIRILGVRHAGEAGINELRRALRGLQSDLISGKLDENILLVSSTARVGVMASVRYEASEWGSGDEEDFTSAVKDFIEAKDSIRPLPDTYVPSGKMDIQTVDSAARDEFSHPKSFTDRYGTLARSVMEARALADDDKALSKIVDRLREKKTATLAALREQLEKHENPKARANIEKQVATLEAVSLESFSKPQEMFSALAGFKGVFDEELRQALFYTAFKMNPEQAQRFDGGIDDKKPKFEDLTKLINFVDHITNQETMAKYFTDPKAAKDMRGMLNVAALEQELARWQKSGSSRTTPFEFVPNRGLISEFSGNFSDACWADKYDSIMSEFPNFIGLTIVQNPGNEKHESIAGGAFLIETVSTKGEPLLVIRGLNPRENVINGLVIRDFFEKITGYLKGVAEKAGRKLAIVIDDHAGGAATNRPALYQYLDGLRRSLEHVELRSNNDTEFNGYHIKRNCYLLEERS